MVFDHRSYNCNNCINCVFNFYKIDKKTGGPSTYYNSKLLKNNIGFITPLTNNFCANCNRVRVTSTGRLYMCLGQNDYIDFREILRKDHSDDYIKENGISLVIDKKNMVGGRTEYDITTIIVEKLNKELPSLNLK